MCSVIFFNHKSAGYIFRRVDGQNTLAHNLDTICHGVCSERKIYKLALTALVDEWPPELGTALTKIVIGGGTSSEYRYFCTEVQAQHAESSQWPLARPQR